jgi:hypothetical protein
MCVPERSVPSRVRRLLRKYAVGRDNAINCPTIASKYRLEFKVRIKDDVVTGPDQKWWRVITGFPGVESFMLDNDYTDPSKTLLYVKTNRTPAVKSIADGKAPSLNTLRSRVVEMLKYNTDGLTPNDIVRKYQCKYSKFLPLELRAHFENPEFERFLLSINGVQVVSKSVQGKLLRWLNPHTQQSNEFNSLPCSLNNNALDDYEDGEGEEKRSSEDDPSPADDFIEFPPIITGIKQPFPISDPPLQLPVPRSMYRKSSCLDVVNI